ncbi:MAG: hypothetical protein J6Y43_04390, partial [Clostridia bacterium]|nr:hypothetical protein [Clostridia bacterium]
EEILNKIAGSKMLIDIYGNMVFSYNGFGNENVVDEYGEIKTDTNKILAQKVQSVYNNLNSTNNRTAANEYYMAQRYHKGSDGRIYRVNFKGDMTNVSVNVLDENCVWQSVENNVDVAFDADSSSGYIAWRIGEMTAVSAYYRITCIKEGYAIYSTAACFDGGRVWERAYYNRSSSNNNGHFVGVVKISTDGNGEEVDIWSDEFYANGLPLNNPYSVILVGNTQMLYFGNNEICLRNVLTGEEKSFSFTFDAKNGYYCSPEFHNNLYVKELGYLNIENEVDFDTFSAASFAQEPVYSETQFDEYYKLLTAK